MAHATKSTITHNDSKLRAKIKVKHFSPLCKDPMQLCVYLQWIVHAIRRSQYPSDCFLSSESYFISPKALHVALRNSDPRKALAKVVLHRLRTAASLRSRTKLARSETSQTPRAIGRGLISLAVCSSKRRAAPRTKTARPQPDNPPSL